MPISGLDDELVPPSAFRPRAQSSNIEASQKNPQSFCQVCRNLLGSTTDSPLTEKAVQETLHTSLRGELITPVDSAYDGARPIWNGMIDRRPAAIARCLGTADVLACLETARTHDVPLTVRSEGSRDSP